MGSAAMRAKEPTEIEAQLGAALTGALGGVLREVMKAAVAEELQRALAAMRLPARPAEPESAYVSRKAAALIMNYHLSTVNRLIAKGLLRASGTRLNRIARREIERFMTAAAARANAAVDEDAALEAEARRIVDEE